MPKSIADLIITATSVSIALLFAVSTKAFGQEYMNFRFGPTPLTPATDIIGLREENRLLVPSALPYYPYPEDELLNRIIRIENGTEHEHKATQT